MGKEFNENRYKDYENLPDNDTNTATFNVNRAFFAFQDVCIYTCSICHYLLRDIILQDLLIDLLLGLLPGLLLRLLPDMLLGLLLHLIANLAADPPRRGISSKKLVVNLAAHQQQIQ